MSAIDQIIARGFNFDPVGGFRRGRENRRQTELYDRELAEYDRQVAEREKADESRAKSDTALSDLLEADAERIASLSALSDKQAELYAGRDPMEARSPFRLPVTEKERSSAAAAAATVQLLEAQEGDLSAAQQSELDLARSQSVPTPRYSSVGSPEGVGKTIAEKIEAASPDQKAPLYRAALEMISRPQKEIESKYTARQQQAMSALIMNDPTVRSSFLQSRLSGKPQLISGEAATNMGLPEGSVVQMGKDGMLKMLVNPLAQSKITISTGEKVENAFLQKMGNLAAADITEIQGRVEDANLELWRIGEFRRLLDILSKGAAGGTGIFTEMRYGINRFLEGAGIVTLSDDIQDEQAAIEALQSLQQDYVAKRFGETKGAVSDREVAMFVAASPTLGKSTAGNLMILAFAEKLALRKKAHARMATQFLKEMQAAKLAGNQDWLGLNVGGKWLEYQEQWRDENPFFTPLEKKQLQIAGEGLTVLGEVAFVDGVPKFQEGATATDAANQTMKVIRLQEGGPLVWVGVPPE